MHSSPPQVRGLCVCRKSRGAGHTGAVRTLPLTGDECLFRASPVTTPGGTASRARHSEDAARPAAHALHRIRPQQHGSSKRQHRRSGGGWEGSRSRVVRGRSHISTVVGVSGNRVGRAPADMFACCVTSPFLRSRVQIE